MQGLKLRLELLVFLFDFLAAAAFLVQFLVQLLEDVFVVALGARGLLRAAPDRLGRQALQIGTPVAIGTDEGRLQFREGGHPFNPPEAVAGDAS